jgi:hypothetical protein
MFETEELVTDTFCGGRGRRVQLRLAIFLITTQGLKDTGSRRLHGRGGLFGRRGRQGGTLMGIVSPVILAELEFTSITRPRKEIQSLHNHQNLSKTKRGN